MITAGLRRAILAAAGLDGAEDGDPLLRPGPAPGSYASSLPFRLARPGQDPREVAAALAGRLAGEPWIAAAEVTGPGFLTVTVTHDALAGLAVRIARAGPACAHSDALRGRVVPAAPPGPLAAAPGWPQARAAFAAQLTARLAAAAGATVFPDPERASVPAPASPSAAQPEGRSAAQPMALPGTGPWRRRPGTPGPTRCGSRWPGCRPAASLGGPPGGGGYRAARPGQSRLCCSVRACRRRRRAALGRRAGDQASRVHAAPARRTGELALLDALSWLPERVAMAARRGRPDEFAGYLEELAARTIETMSTTSFTTISSISSESLWLADAAGPGSPPALGCSKIGAPGRL